MPDEKEYMTNKNETHCSEGDIPCTVKTKGHGVCKEKELYLNATDHWLGKNIGFYGFCRRTGTFCLPDTPKVWIDVDEKALLDGVPRLTEKSRLLCMHGGIISFGKGEPYGINEFLKDLKNGVYRKSIGPNDNKLFAGTIDVLSGVGAIIGGVYEMNKFYQSGNKMHFSLATFGVAKGLSDLEHGRGEINDFVFGTDSAHDYLKEGVMNAGSYFTPISKESFGFMYDVGSAISGGFNGNVELLAKQKDIVSVVGGVQDGALENATNDSKKTAEGIVEKLREPVKYYNEDVKNRPVNITIGELMNELGTVNR